MLAKTAHSGHIGKRGVLLRERQELIYRALKIREPPADILNINLNMIQVTDKPVPDKL